MKKATKKKAVTSVRKPVVQTRKTSTKAKPAAKKKSAAVPGKARAKKPEKPVGRAPDSKRRRVRKTGDDLQIREVLVPIDFSEESRNALKYGMAFSQQFKCHLILMFVVDFPFTTGDLGSDIPRLENQIRDQSEQELVSIAREVARKGHSVETIVTSGRPFHEIIEVANRRKVDLIIVATHGESKVRHVVLGSNAERVARFASCPVLIVREATDAPAED